MCTGAGFMMAGTAVSGVSSLMYGNEQARQARTDAVYEQDAARQQAEKILKAASRERSAARAATAASGAAIDEFSLEVERDITQAGETDAAMTILGGERRARSLESQAQLSKRAGQIGAVGSLFRMGYQAKGWKGVG